MGRTVGDVAAIKLAQLMLIDFCFDSLSYPDLGYPNLAQPGLAPDEFDRVWPRTLPVRLFAYFPLAGMKHRTWSVMEAPAGSWYPVGLGWHDFDCDYFALMPDTTLQRVRERDIRVLFYYHEGDNPYRIKQHLDARCLQNRLPEDCYFFVSANSAARHIDNFYYLPDHEFFFRYVNRHQALPDIPSWPRSARFTAVNRSHKWWRATAMVDLYNHGVLDRSLWSYNTECDVGDQPHHNPLMAEIILGDTETLDNFVSGGPYWCDGSDSTGHNDHSHVNLDLFQQSYCHIVLETHFDADQSGGCFLTEKTFKCLKFGQPFVILGTQHSIKELKLAGYRTFDDVIDHSYDDIEDNTQRYLAARHSLLSLADADLPNLFDRMRPDLIHNQNHFMQRGPDVLHDFVTHLYQLSTNTS